MVGRKVRLHLDKTAAKRGEVALKAEHLSLVDARGVRVLDDVSLELRSGEIVGIAGVSGNGQTELLQILAGIRAPTSGTLTVRGRAIHADRPSDPGEMRDLSLAHVPEDRLRQGMVAAFRASETAILGYHDEPPFTRNYILNTPAVGAHCASLMEQFDVRPRLPGLRSASFSGGNQQKLVLAREISRRPKVLLVGQPTRGVDIGAIEFIHRELVKSRDAGCAVLVVSVELEEILSLADRILVMFAGKVVGEVEAGRADERRLGLMMAGAKAA
jgi:simple sugar transport system ATP-binding protein